MDWDKGAKLERRVPWIELDGKDDTAAVGRKYARKDRGICVAGNSILRQQNCAWMNVPEAT